MLDNVMVSGGGSYEAAPATKMLATHCACCGRPLVDAISVETGVGPDCRKAHGYAEAQGPASWREAERALAGCAVADVMALAPDARAAVNKLVFLVAQAASGVDHGPEFINSCVNAVCALGFTKLASRIRHRLAAVRVDVDPDTGELLVRTPYNDRFVAMVRRVPGRRWNSKEKVNRLPATPANRSELWFALRSCFHGETMSGPKGLQVIR